MPLAMTTIGEASMISMKRLSLATVVLCAACSSPQQAIDARYSGGMLSTVFTDLGPPDEANALSGGQTEYIWRDGATEDGVNPCFRRVLSDGSGRVLSASHTDGRARCS